jgi:signal transduction histidine kinase
MTSLATSLPTTEQSSLRRAAVVAGIVVVGGAAAVLGGWYVSRSPILYRPTASGVTRGLYVAAYVAAGAYTLWRRPASRLGPLLAGVGFVYALASLMGSDDEVAFTLGVIAWAAYVFLVAYTSVSFPRSRPTTSLERTFVRAIWLASSVLMALILVFADELPKGAEFADCGSKCPPNAFQLVDAPEAVGKLLNGLYGLMLAITLSGVAAVLVVKARSPDRLRRRAVEPLSYVIVATVVLFLLNLAVTRIAPGTKSTFWTLEALVALSAPVAIVVGQVRGRMFAAAGAGRLVAALSGKPVTHDGLQTMLRDTLGDPMLVLAVAVPETGAYVDAGGAEVDLSRAAETRTVLPIVRGGRTVAALVHDPALDSDAAVVEGLTATSLMLLENARLIEELRASRERIVTAAEHERLRLERDLHDGAQQRLMAIQIKLALLQERLDEPSLAGELDEISDDAASAVDELRALAHGIYPTVLRERGLGDGLRSLTRTSPLGVEVVDDGIGRCEPAVEAAIYFCAAEAIQNANKYAGPRAHVSVTLERRGDEVAFAIVDDGAGFDPGAATSGTGLVGMRDRIGAVGGEVEVVAAPGRGTAIRGRVHAPLPAGDGPGL